MCGEHAADGPAQVAEQGSSPRVRGTLTEADGWKGMTGIIPACAGNTICRQLGISYKRDHPRVCGEHALAVGVACVDQGSSPRVRGTRHVLAVVGRVAGIIPACAGNTSPFWPHGSRLGDHPRVCGEHSVELLFALQRGGSSPRVRGTPGCRHGE